MNVLGFASELLNPEQVLSFIRDDEIEAIADQFSARVGKDLNVNATNFVDDYSKNFFGSDASFLSSATRNVGNFKFKEFESVDALQDYIASDKIGTSEEWEGICYGFKIHENEAKNKYELELFYNDLWPGWLNAIPN